MTQAKYGKLLLVVAAVAVAAAIAAAIALEPPSESRKRRLDERRVQDLSRVEAVLGEYWRRHKKLPPSLDALPEAGLKAPIADPESRPYDYTLLGERSYRICANFALETGDPSRRTSPAHSVEWSHGAGRQCFERTIRPKSD